MVTSRDSKGRFLKGHKIKTGWGNGSKHTPEALKKISEASKGRIQSKETIQKRVDKRRASDNYNISDDMKKHLSDVQKGRHYSPSTEFKKGQVPIMKGRKWTQEQRDAISISRSGENNNNWMGGITGYKQSMMNRSKYRIWRELILIRDNFICQNKDCEFCNNQEGMKLHSHHIKPFSLYPELMFDVSNGITYCEQFHYKGGLHIGIKQQLKNSN